MSNKIANVVFFKNEEDKCLILSHIKKCETIHNLLVNNKYITFISDWGYPWETYANVIKENRKIKFKVLFASEFIGSEFCGICSNKKGYLDDKEIPRLFRTMFGKKVWKYME